MVTESGQRACGSDETGAAPPPQQVTPSGGPGAPVWACRACGETELGQRVGRAAFCGACREARVIYRTTQNNLRSGFNRTNKGSPALELDIDDFCRWRKAQSLECHYCGITQEELPAVGMRSQIQRVMKVLGVDRLDSDSGYAVGNLVPCCFVCNQVKGNRFTAEEMSRIGPGIGAVWRQRLGRE